MTTTVERKLRRNLGVVEHEGDPNFAPKHGERDSILLVERLLRVLLSESVTKLQNDENECRRFFSHFFDPTVDEDEREEFITNFRNFPPRSIQGYARMGAELPVFSIVLTSDNETDEFVGQFADDEAGTEFVASFFESVYSIYVCASHPIQAVYLYQFAKSVVLSGKIALLANGCHTVSISGGELAPDEQYMPENMYIRVLRVSVKAPATVPRILPVDPRRLKLAGIFAHDVVVDGYPGGVSLRRGSFDDDGNP
jgi:hypothetical protein